MNTSDPGEHTCSENKRDRPFRSKHFRKKMKNIYLKKNVENESYWLLGFETPEVNKEKVLETDRSDKVRFLIIRNFQTGSEGKDCGSGKRPGNFGTLAEERSS